MTRRSSGAGSWRSATDETAEQLAEGNGKEHGRALAECARGPHAALVRLDDAPGDEEPQPEAAPIVVRDLREPLEHLLNLIGRNTGALVAHRTLQLTGDRLATKRNAAAAR